MKKYGINVYEKDNTPGFRSSDTWEEWFENKEERDRRYEFLSAPPVLRYKELGLPDSLVEYTYTKIEREE